MATNMRLCLRQPILILRNLLADRERPDLEALGRIAEPEDFVWAMLPHAARTFSACIALLPPRSALPAAVAYLYCRMLDTYEDLVPDRAEREAALAAFADRLDPERPPSPAPAIRAASDRDARDRAHLLLVERAGLVDRVFETLDRPVRAIIRDLVHDMSEGMRWSSATFAAQSGVLEGDGQLAAYCRHVLGNPTVFALRLIRLHHDTSPDLSPSEREDAMRVGEMVQLANVTRDVEKDLRRGIAYDASLKADLGHDPASDPEIAGRCRQARARMLRMALLRAPHYGRMMESMALPPVSPARAATLLMLRFTERYYRKCARRCGAASWDGPRSPLALILGVLPAIFSAACARRDIARCERAMIGAMQRRQSTSHQRRSRTSPTLLASHDR